MSPRAVLRLSWTLALVGAALLLAAWPTLPAEIPLYRDLRGAPMAWAEPSAWAVGRIPLMGVGQLGAITAMASASEQAPGWRVFWLGASVAAAGKTFVECVQLALSAVGFRHDLLLFALALAPVLAFLGWAAVLWWRGRIERDAPHPSRAEGLVVAASLSLWLGCALLPLLVG